MSKFPMIFASVALLHLAPAAAAPTLSGSYASTQQNFCQTIETIDSNTGGVVKIDSVGHFGFADSTITFDSNAGTFSAAGFGVDGTPVVAKFTDGSKKGRFLKLASGGSSGPYSNTDTTLIVGGETFEIVYGPIVNGVATSFFGVSQVNQRGFHCTEQINAQHQ